MTHWATAPTLTNVLRPQKVQGAIVSVHISSSAYILQICIWFFFFFNDFLPMSCNITVCVLFTFKFTIKARLESFDVKCFSLRPLLLYSGKLTKRVLLLTALLKKKKNCHSSNLSRTLLTKLGLKQLFSFWKKGEKNCAQTIDMLPGIWRFKKKKK